MSTYSTCPVRLLQIMAVERNFSTTLTNLRKKFYEISKKFGINKMTFCKKKFYLGDNLKKCFKNCEKKKIPEILWKFFDNVEEILETFEEINADIENLVKFSRICRKIWRYVEKTRQFKVLCQNFRENVRRFWIFYRKSYLLLKIQERNQGPPSHAQEKSY